MGRRRSNDVIEFTDGCVCCSLSDEQLPEQLEHDVIALAVTAQIASADLLVISKVDLIDQRQRDRITELLAELAPGVRL